MTATRIHSLPQSAGKGGAKDQTGARASRLPPSAPRAPSPARGGRKWSRIS